MRIAISLPLICLFSAGATMWPGIAAAKTVPKPIVGRDCVVKPDMVVDVGSPVQGVLATVKVRRGDWVKKGQIIAELTSAVQRVELRLARERLAFEQRRMARTARIRRSNLISRQERDEIETKLGLARIEVEKAETALKQRQILSPITGIVLDRFVDPGEFIKENKIVKLARIDPLMADVILPLAVFPRVKKGMKAKVMFGPPVNTAKVGTIITVDRVIDAASGMFGAQVRIDNPGNKVPAGVTCTVTLGKITKG